MLRYLILQKRSFKEQILFEGKCSVDYMAFTIEGGNNE